jgi:hypothetical protein
MKQIRQMIWQYLLSFSLWIFCGCQSNTDPNLTHVRGTVTHNGQPVPVGFIIFQPDIAKGNRGLQGYAEIKDGQFDTRQSGKPVGLGAQVVLIRGGDKIEPNPDETSSNMISGSFQVDIVKDNPPLVFEIPDRQK